MTEYREYVRNPLTGNNVLKNGSIGKKVQKIFESNNEPTQKEKLADEKFRDKHIERLEYIYRESNKTIGSTKKFIEKSVKDLKNVEKVYVSKNKKGKIVGFVSYDQGEVRFLAIDPKYKRKGHGTNLMNQVIKDKNTFILNCRRKNKDALKFYDTFPELNRIYEKSVSMFGKTDVFGLVYYQKITSDNTVINKNLKIIHL